MPLPARRMSRRNENLCTAREFLQICSSILHFMVGKPCASDEQDADIGAQFVLHETVCFAHKTLCAAAHGCRSQFFPRSKADFARNARIAQDVEDHIPPREGGSFMIDVLKIAAPLDYLRARERISLLVHDS